MGLVGTVQIEAFRLARGADCNLVYTWPSPPSWMTGSSQLQWALKKTRDKDAAALVTKTGPSLTIDAIAGTATVAIAAADTATLDAGLYWADLWDLETGQADPKAVNQVNLDASVQR